MAWLNKKEIEFFFEYALFSKSKYKNRLLVMKKTGT